MTFRELQKLFYKIEDITEEFNKNSLPTGYFIFTEPDGTILIVNEETSLQTILTEDLLDKENLSEEEVLNLFREHCF